MKPSQLASLCIALGLGTALGLGLGVSQGNDPPAQGPPARANPSRHSQATDTNELVDEAALRIKEGVAASHASTTLDMPSWTGQITGWVIAEDGEPMAGAIVYSSNSWTTKVDRTLDLLFTEDPAQGYQKPMGIEESLASQEAATLESLRQSILDPAQVRTAKSDATGQFKLTGLKEGPHVLLAYADGFVIQAEFTEVGASVELTGRPTTVINLDIRLPDGSQPEEAAVAVYIGGRPSYLGWSPEAHRLAFLGHSVELKVYAGALQKLGTSDAVSDFESEVFSVDLNHKRPAPRLITLRPAKHLRVQVTDTSPTRPKRAVWVKVLAETDDPLDWSSKEAQYLIQEEPDLFLGKDLDEGTYVIGVGRGRAQEPGVTRRVQIGNGAETIAVTLGDPDPASFILVHCVGPAGRPLKDIEFSSQSVHYIDGQMHQTSGHRVDSEPAPGGAYWLSTAATFRPWGEDDRYTASLTATSKRYGTARSPIERQARELTMALAPPVDLIVTLTGRSDEPYAIRLSPTVDVAAITDYDPIPKREFETPRPEPLDPDGTVEFHRLQPGVYDVLLERLGEQTHGLHHRVAQVTLQNPSEEVTVAVPPLHTVKVLAPGAALGTRLRLVQEGAHLKDEYLSKLNFVDREERSVFENVPAGRYTLWSDDLPGYQVIVQVPGEATFEMPQANSMRVVSMRAQGAAAVAGVRVGDFITHVDGKVPSGHGAPQATEVRLVTAQALLTIRRAGATLEIPMGPVGKSSDRRPDTGFHLRAHFFAK